MANLIFTNNTSKNPDYYQVNGGLNPKQFESINRIIEHPNGAIYVACDHGENKFLARLAPDARDFEVLSE